MSIFKRLRRRKIAARCAEVCVSQVYALTFQYHKEMTTHGETAKANSLAERMNFWAHNLIRYDRLSRGKNPWRSA